uniref:(California timema) hypothetical protein n=1 Tax=Timema californicum TaxID=61474 RepID=A0A7R9P807_TIMCA|nr:unnamed protein product [Timema californicum]
MAFKIVSKIIGRKHHCGLKADGEDEPHDISSFILEMGTDKEVICWLCDRVFASKHCLDKHLIKHHRVEPLCLKHHFVCPKSTCSVSTVSYAALGKHMKETHPMFESPGVFIATEESSANTFDCPLCCQGLKRRFTIGELVTHLSNYVWGNLQCPVCRKKIVGIVDLVVHLQNNLCEVDEDGMTEMDTSVVTELNVANSDDKLLGGTHNSYYKCGYCELGFDSSNLLLEHASIIHGVKYMLDSAANTYSLNLFLEQIKSAENKPKESVDGFAVHVDSFRPAVALKQGDESCKHNTKNISKTLAESKNKVCLNKVCHVCGITLSLQTINKFENTSDKFIKCLICVECFSDKVRLTDHVKTMHGEADMDMRCLFLKDNTVCEMKKNDTIICTLCGMLYSNKTEYERHRKSFHMKNYECYCPVCGLMFLNKINLKVHSLSHRKVTSDMLKSSSIKMSSPSIIDMEKLPVQELSSEVSVANSLSEMKKPKVRLNKRYACTGCGHRFRYQKNLRKHEETHPGCKHSHLCHVCDMSFTKFSEFLAHKDIHSGDAQIKCVDCNEGFQTKVALNKHKISHRKILKCKFCNKKFQKKWKFRQHLIAHKHN